MTMHFKPGALERKDGEGSPLEVKKLFDDFKSTFEQFKKANDERIDGVKKGFDDVVKNDEVKKINDALDKQQADIKNMLAELATAKRPPLDGKGKEVSAEAKEYSKKFEDWFRGGDDAVSKTEFRAAEAKAVEKKALVATSDSEAAGGYTVRPEMETQIDATIKEVSPIRGLASVRQTSAGSYKKLVNLHGVTSGWVGERETRPQTLAADLTELDFPIMEIYAMPAATQTLLDDSFVNIDQWLADEVSLEFAQKEGAGFVNGTGIKQPKGFLGAYSIVADASWAWGKIGYVPTGLSAGFAASAPADCLIDLVFSIKAGYRDGASFIMNRKTMAATRKLKDGQGNYLVDLRLRDNSLVPTIFGYAVTEAEDMPAIQANSYSIAFGNWKRGYLIVDRIGIRTLRDPYTSKPYVLFYTTKRVGGGVQNFEAIKLLKFAVS